MIPALACAVWRHPVVVASLILCELALVGLLVAVLVLGSVSVAWAVVLALLVLWTWALVQFARFIGFARRAKVVR